jgi:hypothetical protein
MVFDPSLASPIAGEYGSPGSTSLGTRGKTFLKIATEIYEGLGVRTDASIERCKEWANDAYLELASIVKVPELKGSLNFLAVGGQQLYKLPNGVWTILDVQPNKPLSVTTLDWHYRRVTDLDTWRRIMDSDDLAIPFVDRGAYIKWNQLLALWPVPVSGDAFVLDFRIMPARLEADEDVPIFEEHWHKSIVDMGLAIAHMRLREFDTSAMFRNEVVATIRSKKDKEAEEEEAVIGTVSFPRSWRDLGQKLPRPSMEGRDEY